MDSDDRSPTRGQEADVPTAEYPRTPDVEHRRFDAVAGSYGTIRRPIAEGEPEVSVEATHYADGGDPSVVEVGVRIDGDRMIATLAPEQARTLARRLGEAAKHADEGADE